jgi:hypothetical protein
MGDPNGVAKWTELLVPHKSNKVVFLLYKYALAYRRMETNCYVLI